MHSGSSDPAPAAPVPPPRKRRAWLWLLLALLVAAALVMIWRGRSAPEPQTGAAAEAPVLQLLPSEVYELQPGALRETVQVTGSLAPLRALSIAAEVSGRVDEVNFRVGNPVREGEVLVSISVQALQNRLEQQKATAEATRAQLSLAEAQLGRITDLVKRGVSTTAALESEGAQVAQLQASYAALERQVALAEDDLAKARITAPFSGVVSQRSVDPGTYAAVGMSLMELVDVSSLELEGGVPVNFAPQLKPGQKVELTVDGLAEHRFEGRIERVAPVAVAATRVLPVFARIENREGLLSGGMFASGTLVLEERRDVLSVPADALRRDDSGTFVLKILEGRLQRQPVEIARSWDRGRVLEVRSGLQAGDRIVALAMERLQPDMAVALAER